MISFAKTSYLEFFLDWSPYIKSNFVFDHIWVFAAPCLSVSKERKQICSINSRGCKRFSLCAFNFCFGRFFFQPQMINLIIFVFLYDLACGPFPSHPCIRSNLLKASVTEENLKIQIFFCNFKDAIMCNKKLTVVVPTLT